MSASRHGQAREERESADFANLTVVTVVGFYDDDFTARESNTQLRRWLSCDNCGTRFVSSSTARYCIVCENGDARHSDDDSHLFGVLVS